MAFIGSTERRVDIRIDADDKTKPAIDSARRNLKGLGQDTGTVTGAMRASWLKVAAGIGGLLIAFRGLQRGIGSVIEKGLEHERVYNDVAASIQRHGLSIEQVLPQVQKFTDEMQKLTSISDEVVATAFQRLLDSNIKYEDSLKLTRAAMDLSIAKGMDLATTADLIGKSVDSSTNALSRYGIEIDKTRSKGEQIDQLLESVNSRFGGAAAARMDTTAGKIELLNQKFGDLQERLFALAEPVLLKAVDAAGALLDDFGGDHGHIWGEAWGRQAGETVQQHAERINKRLQEEFDQGGGIAGGQWAANFVEGLKNVFRPAPGTAPSVPFSIATGIYRVGGMSEADAAAAEAAGQAFVENFYAGTGEFAAAPEQEQQIAGSLADTLANATNIAGSEVPDLLGQDLYTRLFGDVDSQLDRRTQAEIDFQNRMNALREAGFQAEADRRVRDLENTRWTAEEKLEIALDSLHSMGEGLRALGEAEGIHSKAAFTAFKAFAIAETIIDAHRAFARALATLPPPWSYVQAAASFAMAIARVAAIKNAQPGGSSGAAAPSVAVPIQPAPPPTAPETTSGAGGGQQINVYIEGNLISMDELSRQLVPSIQKAINDGATP